MLAGGDVALCGPRFILPRCKHFPLITDCLLLYAWAMAVSPDDVDTYLLTERLRGIASMREHNFSLIKDPKLKGQPLLVAELDELGVAIEHFCRVYLSINSSQHRQLDKLLREVSQTLDIGSVDPDEIQAIRSNLLHGSLPQAAARAKEDNVAEYVHHRLREETEKLNGLLLRLLEQMENPAGGDFRKKRAD